MKKIKFYKTMYGGKDKPPIFKEESGYYEEYLDSKGNAIGVCFDNNGGSWGATEITTGMRIPTPYMRTRKDIATHFINAGKPLMDRCYECIQKTNYDELLKKHKEEQKGVVFGV